jgi:antitoxin (DNA-binding transcriptional repressor) of toxin-antitoxin stability system
VASIEVGASFEELEALLSRAEAPHEPVLLTKGGAPFARIVPVAPGTVPHPDADAETRSVLASPVFRAAIARSRRQKAEGRVTPLADALREVGITLGDGERPDSRRGAEDREGR